MLMLLLLLVPASDYQQQEKEWREGREARLKAEDGWLNLVALYFLKEGSNTFGTGKDMDLALPDHSTVPFTGTFFLENGVVRYELNRAQRGVINGEDKPEGTLRPATVDHPADVLAHNNLRFFVIERGDKLALRVRDLRAKAVRDFKPLKFYRARPDYEVEAEFVPFAVPETITISTIIGTEYDAEVPGILRFTWDEQPIELWPVVEEDQLFIIFKDKTSGSTTYPAGRFLYASKPDANNKVILNFNRAYSPPCAFTDFATCPLPPAKNWLPVAIEAGEKFIAEGHQ